MSVGQKGVEEAPRTTKNRHRHFSATIITYADIATEFRYLFRGSLRNSRQTGYVLLVIPLSDLLWEKFGIAQGEAQRSQEEEAENGGSDANRSQ